MTLNHTQGHKPHRPSQILGGVLPTAYNGIGEWICGPQSWTRCSDKEKSLHPMRIEPRSSIHTQTSCSTVWAVTVQQVMHGVCLQSSFHSNYFWCKTHSKYGLSLEAHEFRCLGLRPAITHLMPLLQSSVTSSSQYETVQLAGQIHQLPAVS